jgi:CDP-diacylglycerol--glycerol-3-phosphate 3-phosphatidyltransferase
MNFPNKLTLLRVLLIPVFVMFFFMSERLSSGYVFGLFSPYRMATFIVFIVAAITDALDGYIARKRNLITNFGKLMDPLADKLLTLTAFFLILIRWNWGWLGIIFLLLIAGREFIVTSIRLVAAEKGVVIAADGWGKLKTVLQMVWICYALFLMMLAGDIDFSQPNYLEKLIDPMLFLYRWLLYIVVVVTVGSGVNYCIKSRKLFRDM